MNMILKEGTTIPIVDGSYTGAVVLIVEDRQTLIDIWAQLTTDNLAEVRITKDDDTPLNTLHGAVMDSMQVVTNPDGTLTAHFYLSETITGDVPTDTEYVQAAKILLGEEV